MSGAKMFRSDESDYWDTYLAVRPKYYTSGFYDHLLAYHHKHGNGSLKLAHDIACGPGNVAAELAKHFEHVVASDINGSNVAAARSRLEQAGIANVSFTTTPGEAIGQHATPKTVDFIAVAESIALMDMPKSLSAFHAVLKPGGTVAMWLYGRPHFVAPDGQALDEPADAAYLALADYTMLPLTEAHPEMYAGPMRHFNSWADSIEIPSTEWKDVERRKWNTDAEMGWMSADLGGMHGRRGDSRVGGQDKCVEVIDRSFWAAHWTSEDAVRFIRFNMPQMPAERFVGEDFDRLCRELEEAFGGKGEKRQVTWPVVLILASKQ